MRALCGFTLSFAVLAGVPAASVRGQQLSVADSARQPTQRDVARMLVSADSATQAEGFRMAQMVHPAYASKELRLGLIVALNREAAAHKARLRVRREAGGGAIGQDRAVTQFHDQLLTTVIAHYDSVSIPSLANSLGTGMLPIRTLTVFGDAASVAVLRIAGDSTSEPEQVADALLTLRMMVESTPRPLTSARLSRVRSAATGRLSGRQSLEVLLRAIDLAIVLGDADLRRTVSGFATDADKVMQRGITDSAEITTLQQRARDRLAGVLPQPRR